LVVSTHLKNMSKIENHPQVGGASGLTIKHI